MTSRIHVRYLVRGDAKSIAARAEGIAVEQSVEMPVEPIGNPFVIDQIIGRVEDIHDQGNGLFDVRIGLATITTGLEAGQLLNMIIGNTSMQDDVTLADAEFPAEVADAFGGPRHGLAGLRERLRAPVRALTATALKPQGSSAAFLAKLAGDIALGGIDYIKDDHGIANQFYSPYAERVPAIAEAVARGAARTGVPTRYLPSLNGNLDAMRGQIGLARSCGLDCVLIAPLIAGLAQFQTLVTENPDFAFMTHPTMSGTARIRPSFLLGKLFRMLGSDATVFANYGGRFGYTAEECGLLSRFALQDWPGIKPCVPVPAGGMLLERIPEMLNFFGTDVMLLIGGSLLSTRERIAAETARYVEAVRAAAKG
ncbi:MAG: ribulose 1,5-bisphosphate carboxylase [Alphaproteobacteria bacterium]|nr:ribulose 1,5-bisphosphate carboxylase [Alphaproteobacteria bacterium]